MTTYIACSKCGGAYGTLVSKEAGDKKWYEHMREVDCVRTRAAQKAKAKVLAQRKPKQEVKDEGIPKDTVALQEE